MQIIIPFLFAILLLGCDEKEVKISEPPKLDCSSSCDDEKIKDWYQKKYGELITNFELSVTKVDFKSEEGKSCKPSKRPENKRYKPRSICCIAPQFRSLVPLVPLSLAPYNQHFNVSITKTTTNALLTLTKTVTGRPAKYLPKDVEGQFETELNMEEWLDLIRVLCRLTNEWEKEYGEYGITAYTSTFGERLCVRKWFLDVYSSDKNEPDTFRGIEAYPPNWAEFKEIIDEMEAKLNGEITAKIMEETEAE